MQAPDPPVDSSKDSRNVYQVLLLSVPPDSLQLLSTMCQCVCVCVAYITSHHAFHLQETPEDEAVIGTSEDCSVLLVFVVAPHQIAPYISSAGHTCKGSSD